MGNEHIVAKSYHTEGLTDMIDREQLQTEIDNLLSTAESGEQWAEICRLEALLNDGPWYREEV